MFGRKRAKEEPSPEEEAAVEAGLERVAEEKRRALLDPGPSWKVWFLYDNARWWMALLFLIVDVWIVASWLEPVNLALLLPSLAAALYLEYLGYSYLWHKPSAEGAGVEKFRPRWYRPFEFGRWTAEADRAKVVEARRATLGEGAPDPREFL